MSDEKRFAVYDAVADSVLFNGHDVSEWNGQIVADAINAAVARERREAAAGVIEKFRALLMVADWDCDMQGKSHRDSIRRWFDAHLAAMDAAVERGES